MSSIASFYLLKTSKLQELSQHAEIIVKKGLFSKKVTDTYNDYLANNATELASNQSGGYLYATLLVFLQEEKNIDLLTNEHDAIAGELVVKRGVTHFIFTRQQRDAHLRQLEPSLYSLSELQQFNQDFSEDGDEETAALSLDAIKVLHDNLKQLGQDDEVLLLIVG